MNLVRELRIEQLDSEVRTVLGLSRQRILIANSLTTGGMSISLLSGVLVHPMPVHERTAKDSEDLRPVAIKVL